MGKPEDLGIRTGLQAIFCGCFWLKGMIKSIRLRTFSLQLLVPLARWPVAKEKGVENNKEGTPNGSHFHETAPGSRRTMFYVNNRWLGGMLTNFKTIRTRIDRLNQIDKMEQNGQSSTCCPRRKLSS